MKLTIAINALSLGFANAQWWDNMGGMGMGMGGNHGGDCAVRFPFVKLLNRCSSV
jgi:hypothetical protein